MLSNSALADPFRATNPREVGDQTEQAFKAMFEQGNYVEATELLQTAEASEPLAHALKASLAYMDEDWDTMSENAQLTLETAEKLLETDPLRGNLYIAAGLFLEGAHTVSTQGIVQSTPTVLRKLQQVFNHLNEAERIDPADPELNLLKGYMDLMLAVNLPFSDPEQAIERLENYAAPSYLAQRGIAIGYRDLEQPDKALAAVDQALQETPNNPELFYLKAQILRLLSDDAEGDAQKRLQGESLGLFRQAWTLRAQMPESTVDQMEREACRTFQQSRDRDPNACGDRQINWQRTQQASEPSS
ncbi:MAG: Sll0314/Alr1548 family TPR repeat-containing protein [Elainellaceae cyanobacterium]